MRRTLLAILLIGAASCAMAQTAFKLIEKYRKLPNATYMDTSKETLKSYDENPDLITEEERAQLKKSFKKSETVQIEKCDEEQLAQIDKDIKALKGYELLFTTNKNGGSDEDANVFKQMMSDMWNPTIKLKCYGKVKGKTVSDLLVRLEWLNTVALSHIDTKIDRDLMTKALMADGAFVTEFDDDDDDGEVVEMGDVLEEVKKGNVLFVINGKECPDLHSTEEAAKYMEENDYHFNVESWVVGGAVKEKYPNTDKKVVIEFFRSDKETK